MRTVEIEATNQCNTRCLHCPHETITRPSGTMTWDTFQVVADKILAYGQTEGIDFAGMGEPTLNKDLYRFINYFSGKIDTYITTNAATLTPRNIERLIEAGLSTVIVSFNGTEPALYESMMGGLSFKRAESYLTDLIKRAEGRMRVVANVSVTKQTQNRLSGIKQYLQGAGVAEIFFSKCHSRGGHLNAPIVCDTPMPPVDTGRCDIYANTLFVAWTGEVLACCHDLDGVASVGNLITQPLKDILAHKQAVLQNGGVRYDICGSCNDLYRFAQDPLPNGDGISDWVYTLYQNPTLRAKQLSQLAQTQEVQLTKASTDLRRLETLITQYEQGRMLRLLHSLGIQKTYQPCQDESHSNQSVAKGQEIMLVDWLGDVYKQEKQDIGIHQRRLKIQEEQLATLSDQIKTAQAVLARYKDHPFIRVMRWMKTQPVLAAFFSHYL